MKKLRAVLAGIPIALILIIGIVQLMTPAQTMAATTSDSPLISCNTEVTSCSIAMEIYCSPSCFEYPNWVVARNYWYAHCGKQSPC